MKNRSLVRCFSVASQAAWASSKDLKGEPMIRVLPWGGRCGDRATAPIEEIWCEKIRGCSCREATRLALLYKPIGRLARKFAYALIAINFRFAGAMGR